MNTLINEQPPLYVSEIGHQFYRHIEIVAHCQLTLMEFSRAVLRRTTEKKKKRSAFTDLFRELNNSSLSGCHSCVSAADAFESWAT